MKLEGRTALVTGGSRGIGRAIALALAEEGADVAINYVSSEAAARERGRRRSRSWAAAPCSPRPTWPTTPTPSGWRRTCCRSSGTSTSSSTTPASTPTRRFVKMDHASWRKVLAINLDGVFNCTKVFVDQMLKQSYGRVVNITSVIGQIGNFGQANYAASKAGVAAFTKSLAKELAGKGITVNAVAPGFIETEMVAAIPEKVRAKLLEQIPLQALRDRPRRSRAPVVYIVLHGRRLHHGRRALHQRRPADVGRAEEHPVL